MKKLLFVLSTLLIIGSLKAQSTSFEADEGYELGEIIGQNGWGGFSPLSESYLVSDDMATDGDYSLKIGLDFLGIIPSGSVIGPTRDISQQVPNAPARYEVSADLYITSSEEGGEIDFSVYGAGGTESLPAATIALLDGRVLIIELSDFSVGADIDVPTETFIRLSMLFDFENEETLYFIDEDLVYTGNLNLSRVTGYGFLSTGKAIGYVDNITATDNPTLGVTDVESSIFSHYVDNGKLYLKSHSIIEEVSIYNLNGQKVLAEAFHLTDGIVELDALTSGVYLVRLKLENESRTFKFFKQ